MGKPRVKEVKVTLDENKLTAEEGQMNLAGENPENSPQQGIPAVKKEKTVKAKRLKTRSKRFEDLSKKIDKNKAYNPKEAIELVKSTATTKFDSTVEIHINLGTDPSQSNQQVRGTVVLPHGTGKKPPKILVFAAGDTAKEAAGEDIIVGDDQIIEKIQKGWLDFDKVVATPEMMGGLGKIAKQLGPKGLMPNPKAGTITNDIAKTVKEIRSGLVEFRTESAPIIHTVFGKTSMGKENLLENLTVLLEAIDKSKPSAVKSNYINAIFISSTMSPSIKLDLTKVPIS